MSTFQLDRTIFNPALYKQVIDVWFPDMDLQGRELDTKVMQRWFMAAPEERRAFDGVCREAFAPALEAIGPENFPDANAQPFLDEVAAVARKDQGGQGEDAAWTALSLTLLLDQMPRNIYRTDEGLRNVFTHYDNMSFQFTRALLDGRAPVTRLDTHPLFRYSAAHRLWFYMPLMHSEDIAAHQQVDHILDEYRRELEGLPGYAEGNLKGTQMFLDGQSKAEVMHREILDRFGRYPHRNRALGRQSTEEEEAFLQEGGATFGVGQGKKASS
ncbi:DUF924-domain-containing protein [Cucurbitaria berberidis CBS 394.84]|uniref:DUF924-domain-containing protein n=1 Tax=Cucurbitaria berberidis CBS 394.84 TaxID=1168544 RepID=A0A9P4GBI2_9PLEO|nr:DUF924-domain-containing protein [Cucurbitaria berberidis CBS 394.84]KAF1842793.1 DUF924-domain-containing protein [Cucurbitaria berberidis CBS 394.84]